VEFYTLSCLYDNRSTLDENSSTLSSWQRGNKMDDSRQAIETNGVLIIRNRGVPTRAHTHTHVHIYEIIILSDERVLRIIIYNNVYNAADSNRPSRRVVAGGGGGGAALERLV